MNNTNDNNLGEDGEVKHAIVYQPVDSDVAEVEIFDSQDEAQTAMGVINSAFNKKASTGLAAGAIINGKVVTVPPTHVHLTNVDLKKAKEDAKQRKADADEAAHEAEEQRAAERDRLEKESNVLGSDPDGEGNPDAGQNPAQRNQM